MNKRHSLIYFFLSLLFPIANTTHGQNAIDSLKLIDQKVIFPGNIIKGTEFGGISGIDRKPNGEYVLISDDRSEHSPARFYIADIRLTDHKIDSVYIKDVKILKRSDSSTFPIRTIDPESIRFKGNRIYWTSEGSRKENIQPTIGVSDTAGYFIKDIPLDKKFRNTKIELGLRENASIEACSFSADGKYLWMANEAPLYEDGPEAQLTETSSPIRLTLVNPKNGKVKKQYAYMLERVTNEPVNNGFKINSVPEILAVSERQLLVLEREYSFGKGNIIKLYRAEIGNATNIKTNRALKSSDYKPITKKLIIDFSTLGLQYIDNVEGMTFGPDLPNGNKTLVFVSDDNFNEEQLTQFIAFEVLKK